MNRINAIRENYYEALDKKCLKHKISFISVKKLLEAEKTKKLLKRNALIQQTIDNEIENSIENEN